MKLLLSVTSQNTNPNRASKITLNRESASIGRNEDNTLVLYDPKKYISGHHALIEYRPPDYYITDISSNGVLINGYTKPLGKGNSKKLSDGDQLQIGDYTVSVKFMESSFNPVSVSSEPLFPQDIAIFDDPFVEFEPDHMQKFIDSNELIPSDRKPSNDFPDDLFDFPGYDSPVNTGNKYENTAFEHIPIYKEAFQPIPNIPKKPVLESIAPEPATALPDMFSEDWFSDKADSAEGSFIDKGYAVENTGKETSTQPPAIEPTPKVHVSTPAVSPETPIANELATALIENFLRGAKLENSKFAEAINPETFFIIGTMLRASVQGARDVLEGRARIKNEMHLDVTLIKPRENNPIKFSVSTEEALAKLLSPADKAYLPPETAINEAFDDIKTHQYSVIAGMKSALIAILKRFDPKILEDRLQKQSPVAANIPIHKQAKLWNLFEELYETLEQETKDNFYHLFGQAFAETYRDLMGKLKKDNIR